MKYFISLLFPAAVERAETIAKQADVIAALTLEVLKGTTTAFESGKFFPLVDNYFVFVLIASQLSFLRKYSFQSKKCAPFVSC